MDTAGDTDIPGQGLKVGLAIDSPGGKGGGAGGNVRLGMAVYEFELRRRASVFGETIGKGRGFSTTTRRARSGRGWHRR